MKKRFSLPLYVEITASQFDDFKKFLKTYAALIFDVYFSYPVPPFAEDAAGGIRQSRHSWDSAVYRDLAHILTIQEETGIPVSATFNNIFIPSSEQNLELFMGGFAPLYEAGIRSVTLPFSSWVYSGKIQKAFPELFIKNTVLWKVHAPREIWNLGKTGFRYINIDRTLLRDRTALEEIARAREAYYEKTGTYIYLSILANELPCQGHCPFREEHYGLICRHSTTVHDFPSPANTCLFGFMTQNSWQEEPNFFKLSVCPPFREDSDELLQLIDVFKLFGRVFEAYFSASMHMVAAYAAGKGPFPRVAELLSRPGLEETVKAWRKAVKNCTFSCYKCSLCDRLLEQIPPEERGTLLDTMVLWDFKKKDIV